MLVDVTFTWSDKHGPCYDCGRPAAFLAGEDIAICAVCAANRAADGDQITRIEGDA
jgi:hypothetical protein